MQRSLANSMKKIALFLLIPPLLNMAAVLPVAAEGLPSSAKEEEVREQIIYKAEAEAIRSIQNILKKKKGSPEEPDLQFRLAEMYLRKAKTARFFEMKKTLSADSKKNVQEAVLVLSQIVSQHKNFSQMDSVLYFLGFSHQTLGQSELAEKEYLKLVDKYPKSKHLYETQIAIGEINYDKGRFAKALAYFQSVAEKSEVPSSPYATYKSAWCHYNIKDSLSAFETLKKLLAATYSNAKAKAFQASLRNEIVKDLTLFYSDINSSKNAVSVLKPILNPEEFTLAIKTLASIYSSHSRHKDSIALIEDSMEEVSSPQDRADLYLKLSETYEITKQHKELTTNLAKAGKECSKVGEKPKSENETCAIKLPQYSAELIQKFWDLWKKGKGEHKATTKDLFENHLVYFPTPKVRISFADFLFQTEEFAASSLKYEEYSDLEKGTVAGDASESLYSALAAAAKIPAKEEQKSRQKHLAHKYLSRFPKAAREIEAQFLVASLEYEAKNYAEAEKYFALCLKHPLKEKNLNIVEKTEDILLDIYNIRKEFPRIALLATSIMNKTNSADRKKVMKTLIEEADYAKLAETQAKEVTKSPEVYFAYFQKHPNSKLGRNALLSAFDVASLLNRPQLAQQYYNEFLKYYPDDSLRPVLTRKLALQWIDFGQPRMAKTLLATSQDPKDLEAKVELTLNFGSDQELLKMISENEQKASPQNKADKGRLYFELLTSRGSRPSNDPVNKALEKYLNQEKQEPYFSELQSRVLEREFLTSSPRQWSDFFAKATKIVNNKTALPESRARARLIQASILEKEFLSQGMKASDERRELVVAIKVEKLAKAQEALLSAANLDPRGSNLEITQNRLVKIYSHFIESFNELPPIVGLDYKALTSPIAQKLEEIQTAKANNKAGPKPSATFTVNFSQFSKDKSLPPMIPTHKHVIAEFSWSTKKEFIGISHCLARPEVSSCQKALEEVTRKEIPQIESLIVSTLVEILNENSKGAQWILSAGIKKYPEMGALFYLRAFDPESESSGPDLVKAAKLGVINEATLTAQAIDAMTQNNCHEVVETQKNNAKILAKNNNFQMVLSECMARQGDTAQAYKLVKSLPIGIGLELSLLAARIAEDFMIDFSKALSHYQQALKQVQKNDSAPKELGDWLSAKVKYLKTLVPDQKEVAVNSRSDS